MLNDFIASILEDWSVGPEFLRYVSIDCYKKN